MKIYLFTLLFELIGYAGQGGMRDIAGHRHLIEERDEMAHL